MRLHNLTVLGVLLLGLAFGSGCSGLEIKYKPTTPVDAVTKTSIALRVDDARPMDRGRETGTRVGTVRGSFGIPEHMEDKNADVAPHTVTDATADALRRSGVGVQAGSAKTLVATINEFWMDGFMGYACKVVVVYALNDASGKAIWNAEVTGASGGSDAFSSPKKLTLTLFTRALADLSTHAGEQFSSPAFQQALNQ